MDSSKKFVNPSPEIKANVLSKIFFCWILPFFKYGYNRDLEVKDIYNVVNDDKAGPLGNLLEKAWENEHRKAKNDHRPPSLKRAIYCAFWRSYAIYGAFMFIEAIVLKSLLPLVLAQYIAYFEEKNKIYDMGLWQLNHQEAGWILGTLVIFLSFLYVVIIHYAYLSCRRIGIRIRVACCSVIYRKMLKLNHASLGKTAAGQLVNLLSNDVERFETVARWLHYLWIMPISFVVSFYIMTDSVGLASIAAMVVIAVQAIPFQGYLSKLQGRLRLKIAQKTDYRVKLMSEIVSGIQVIKMYAWEKPFEKLVELSRRYEVNYITKTSYIKGFTSALAVFTERFILYLIVVVNLFLGKLPTSDVVFSMAQLINTIQLYMCIFFPAALAAYSEAKVSVKRLENFLLLEERNLVLTDSTEDVKEPGLVEIKNANASWMSEPIVDTLVDINLKIPPGTLCCVVGNVGSGKSSLLHLLLKEMPLKKGSIEVKGHVSYASQEPWLFVSNVRNNILFGQPYLKNRYDEVVDVCALEKDFKQFPFADKTMVGERGVSLSGGQRARINLARAVYTEADIYLFDDPLSAVDTHVSKHLFEKCIKNYLCKKTRILVTHQLQYLKEADMIIFMNNGKIEKVGTFSEISESVLRDFERQESKNDNEKDEQEKYQRERIKSIVSIASSGKEIEEEEPEETHELLEKGSLSGALYLEYFKSGSGIPFLLFLVILSFVSQAFCNFCDLWVTHWTNMEKIRFSNIDNFTNIAQFLINDNETSGISTPTEGLSFSITNESNTFDAQNDLPKPESYAVIYTIFIVGSIVLSTARAIVFYKVCMNSSKGLHNRMFANVLKAPMRFFDTNPSGRILNRFSKDIGAVDEILPNAMYDVVQVFLVMGGILALNFIVTPWMIIPAVVLGSLFYYLRVVYLSTAQNVKRLEAATRAPVFSHISATLYGMPTIRSSNAQDMVTQEFDSLQDQHTGSSYLFQACSEAFGFYLDCISTAFLALVTFQFLIGNGNVNSAEVGLVISSSLILTGMLQVGVRQSAEVASNMTSVERLVQYVKLKTEDDLKKPPTKKPADWPSRGKIVFANTYLRYALEELPVLKDLNISIEPGEKVGIVGRTGAGKSTLIASLFRLAPIEGTIAIDDVDTADISLEQLRSNISIIPQEPILFSSTVRYNLDPFDKASDGDVWQALADVELKNSIESLNQQVSEGGSNFSAGQRQLICLARAILRNNKVLVMDEATANVDPNTDSLIQKTIREKFKNCTVLTIAHRLNTIMDSDKVLVMDAGVAVEYAPPHELLQNSEGYFSKMVEQTGTQMATHLREEAFKAYRKTVAESSNS
ncbi:ATP-binding cassette sub-family C member 4 [Leptinotarsa decemlineata]|uniref:ATP-binding cassette sub-family C member 4 n=1 Tax=Leptinotarsa decemlineata TaxID=7539 RepID=UPI003D30A41C